MSKLRIIGSATLAMSLAVGVPALAGATQVNKNAKHLTLLQRGLAFYKGKTITLICPVSVGGQYDVNDLAAAPVLSNYLHATVNVEDINTGGSVGGEDTLAASAPNGLTIGNMITQSYVGDLVKGTNPFNFNIRNLVDLGATPTGNYVIATLATSPYKTLADIKNASTPVEMASTTSSFEDNLATGVLGLNNVKFVPYSSASTALTGFERGDTPLVGEDLSEIETEIKSSEIRPLLLWGTPEYPRSLKPYLKGVPTLTGYIKTHPVSKTATEAADVNVLLQEYQGVFMAPRGTPLAQVTALKAALKVAMTSLPVRTSDVLDGMGPGYIPASKVNSAVAKILSLISVMKQYAG